MKTVTTVMKSAKSTESAKAESAKAESAKAEAAEAAKSTQPARSRAGWAACLGLLALAAPATAAPASAAPATAAPAAAPPASPAPSASPAAPAAGFAGSGIADWITPPPPSGDPTFRLPDPRRLRLRNGLTVLVVENHALPIVAMTLVVPGAGAAFDPPGKLGLASFTADLLDEGAGGLSALALAEHEERLGATIEAYADYDAGAMAVRTLQKSLDGTLELMAKQLAQPAFEPREVERVRGDRLTALAQRRDRPREVAHLMLTAALYGARSPYGHPIAGYPEDLRVASVDDARAFYRQRWQPSRATLVVAGDVDPATLVARLEPTLGRWKAAAPGAPAQLPVAAAAPQVAPSRLLVADRPGAEQSDVRLGLVGPGRADPRFYAFEVLRTALGDGFTSRLTQRLREELGITYGAQALMDWRLRRGPFAIATALVTAETGTGIAETLRILGELAKVEMPANELEKSKQNLIRALPAELESNLSTSAAIAGLVQLGLSPSWYGTYAAKIRRVSAREVRAAAQALLPANKMILAVVGDLSVLRAALAPLGLGPALPHDPYGMVQPAPAPAP